MSKYDVKKPIKTLSLGDYVQYGAEREKEMMKLSKKTLINMIRNIKTAT